MGGGEFRAVVFDAEDVEKTPLFWGPIVEGEEHALQCMLSKMSEQGYEDVMGSSFARWDDGWY